MHVKVVGKDAVADSEPAVPFAVEVYLHASKRRFSVGEPSPVQQELEQQAVVPPDPQCSAYPASYIICIDPLSPPEE